MRCKDLPIDGLPNALREWETIDVSAEEAEQGATNVLILDENRVVMDTAQPRSIEALRQRQVEVLAVSVGLGGGLRSAHCALWRQ